MPVAGPAPTPAPDVWVDLHERMSAFVRRRISDPHAAQDVAQEILLRLHRSLGDLRDEDRLYAFAYRIARNAITDHYRAVASSREHVFASDEVTARLDSGDPDEGDAGDDLDARHELACCLQPLVDHLAEPYREALRLTDLGELTQADAAHRAGLSVPGMKARVQRARAQLRELLTACCTVDLDAGRRIGEVRRNGPCSCAHPEVSGQQSVSRSPIFARPR